MRETARWSGAARTGAEDCPLPRSVQPARSDHFDGRRFFNPGAETDRSLADLWRWRRTSKPAAWPERRVNRPHAPPPRPAELEPGVLALTFIGQATFLLTTPLGTILTDPVFSERISPFSRLGPKRVRPPGLALAALPPIDLILLSHNHYDHMDLPSLVALQRQASGPPPILTGLGNAHTLATCDIGRVQELDWWEGADTPLGRITFVPAQHWSSRTMFDRRRALWGGFVIETGPHRIYFAGDSGYCPWFKTIGARCGPPDLALLPIGAYEPRWFMRAQHMDPAEAVAAHRDLGARRSVGMHFGTVQLTDEAIDAPLEALHAACAEAGLPEGAFRTLDFGETQLFRKG